MSEPDPNPMPLGRVEGAVAKLFTKPATVQALADVAEDFRLVTLAGAALRQVAWSPGQKVQVLLGGWVQRTYTPLAWDPDAGVTQLLTYAHGTGPGAAWARALRAGAPCHIFGPRRSLELSSLERPALLFGDETSFGLAHALRFTPHAARDVHIVLEVGSSLAARTALAAIGVTDAHLVERRAGDAHLDQVLELASELRRAHAIDAGALSGKATSIARLGKYLRQLGVPRSRLLTKAYWAEGKTGLD